MGTARMRSRAESKRRWGSSNILGIMTGLRTPGLLRCASHGSRWPPAAPVTPPRRNLESTLGLSGFLTDSAAGGAGRGSASRVLFLAPRLTCPAAEGTSLHPSAPAPALPLFVCLVCLGRRLSGAAARLTAAVQLLAQLRAGSLGTGRKIRMIRPRDPLGFGATPQTRPVVNKVLLLQS